MAENPFVIGAAARGGAFAGRKGEIARITADLLGGSSLIVSSPRRYGKTSLLLGAADALRRRGAICAYVNFYAAATKERLVRIMASSLVAAGSGGLDGVARAMRDIVPPIGPPAGPGGAPGRWGAAEVVLPTAEEDVDGMLSMLCDLTERIAARHKKRVVVMLDEFQEVARLEGGRVADAMGSRMRGRRGVSYVFAGRRQRAFRRMFEDSSGALFGSGKVLELQRIPREELARLVREGFEGGGIAITEKAVSGILDAAGCHPHCTQLLCREIWAARASGGRGPVDGPLVGAARDLAIRCQDSAYSEAWDSMPGGQRSLLLAMAASGQRGLYGADFLLRHGLGAPSTVSRSAGSLEDRGVLERGPDGYSIQDPFFEEWVRRMT